MINQNFKIKLNLFIGIFLFFIACSPTTNENNLNSSSNSREEEELISLTTNQQKLLDAINDERSARHICGTKSFPAVLSLKWNTQLYAAAFEHSTDMAMSNTFSHNGSGTEYDITGNGQPSKLNERVKTNGYGNYLTIGENIAAGQNSLAEVMKLWMSSAGHCENIMNADFKEVGVAFVVNENSTYKIYWTQNFGARK